MANCRICGDHAAAGPFDLCPECDGLFAWFMDGIHRDFGDQGEYRITPETTFRELSVESLDRVEWLIEAEEEYGVALSDEEAERCQVVADFLALIRRRSPRFEPG